MLSTFGYGMARFPDYPIEKCVEGRTYLLKEHPDGYCGKQGQPHTAADYALFENWQRLLFIGWPVGMAALVILLRWKVRAT